MHQNSGFFSAPAAGQLSNYYQIRAITINYSQTRINPPPLVKSSIFDKGGVNAGISTDSVEDVVKMNIEAIQITKEKHRVGVRRSTKLLAFAKSQMVWYVLDLTLHQDAF